MSDNCILNMISLYLLRFMTYVYFRRDPNDGSYLIDRTPAYFEPILNFLRTGSLIINPNLNAEGINNEIKDNSFQTDCLQQLLMLDQCPLLHLLLEGVYEEAKYFGIYELLPQLESIIEDSNKLPDESPLSRRDVINATVMTDSNRYNMT